MLVLCLWAGFMYTSATAAPSGDSANEMQQASAATKSVKVVVRDVKGETVIGAKVALVGTTRAVLTDVNGMATIKVAEGQTLEVSFLGFVPFKVVVGKNATINVELREDAQAIDEVVVVGYGKQKRSGMVSSVNTVTAKEIKMPTRNLTNNLAGQMAGIIAIQRSGEPGYDDAEFWIRGQSTFKGGTSPLVLVDGIPRKMSDIETDEIDTFSLLKDAAATAVYGAEGANGVILITSKRGKIAKPRISVRGEYNLMQPTRLPDFLGSVEFMDAYNDGLWNEGTPDLWTQEEIQKYALGPNHDNDLYPNVNWLDMLRKNTSSQRYTINFTGGTEKARYFVGASVFNETGIFKNNKQAEYKNNIGLTRYGLRSNVDIDVSKTTILSVDMNANYTETNFPGHGTSTIFERMTTGSPNLMPFVYSDGTLSSHPDGQGGNRQNPYNMLMNSGYQKEWRVMLQSKLNVEQRLDFITKGLYIRAAVSFDADMMFSTSRTKSPNAYSAIGRDEKTGKLLFKQVNVGSDNLGMSNGSSGAKRIYIDGSINWARVFNEKHDVSAMVLYMQKEEQFHDNSLPFRKQSIVGRVTYSFDSRYSMEANFGLTGSENFAAGNRFGLFPSVGVSWYLSNEHFYTGKVKEFMPKLKFRASYGITGNDNTGSSRFLFRGTLNQGAGGYNMGWSDTQGMGWIGNGIQEAMFDSPNIAWETETKQNYGIDIAIFKGALDLSVDYFMNERSGILLQRSTVSNVAGFNQNPWQNFGTVSNHGVDASVVFNKRWGDWTLGVRGNFTFARNKIIEMDEVPQKYEWMNQTGKRIGEKNLFQSDGFYRYEDFEITGEGRDRQYKLKDGVPNSALGGIVRPGDLKYKDINGDMVIDQYDQVRGGMPDAPEIVYGFGANVEWKGIYLSIFFQGAGNTSTVLGGSNSQGWFPFAWNRTESSLRSVHMDRWTDRDVAGNVIAPNWNATFPRISTTSKYNNQVASTHWLRDASFLRLKNIELGYNFPKTWMQKIGFQSARFYVMGYNLAVWDQIKMWDPEIGNANAGFAYPLPTTITFGLEFVL